MSWRYAAQRATTGEWLNRELPFLRRDTASMSLNGSGRFAGIISPDYGQKVADDGMLILERDATILWAMNGSKHYAYLLDRSEWAGGEWHVEGQSIAGYPYGEIFDDDYRGVKVDPADVFRRIWDELQSYPDGDFGVRVVGDTPIRIGTDSDLKAAAAKTAADSAEAAYKTEQRELAALRSRVATTRKGLAPRKHDRSETSKQLTAKKVLVTAAKRALTAAKKTKNAAKIADAQRDLNAAIDAQHDWQNRLNAADKEVRDWQGLIKRQAADVDAQEKVTEAAQNVKDAKADAKRDADQKASADGGAYKILWVDNPNCGSELDTLAETTPFDWTEESHIDGDDTSHVITIHYPRAGRYRDDLRFVQGENIMARAEPVDDGADFANAWVGIGAGEGSGSVHRRTAVRDGHVRRTKVFVAKDVKSAATMDRKLARRLAASRNVLKIPSIVVRDHKNARIASWDLGDDILVQVRVEFLGTLKIKHRIVGWTPLTDTTARLDLERSDSFLYGG